MIVNLVHYYDIIGTLMMQSVGVLSLQLLGIGSAYSFVSAVLLGAFLNRGGLLVNLWTYALGMFVPPLGSTKIACIVLDVFIPLVCSTTFLSSSTSYTLIIDWATRCRWVCGTYHRVSRHTRTISHRTAHHALLAPILSTRAHKCSHDNEHRDPSYSDGIYSLFTFQ